MITNGFLYLATIIFIAALLICLPKIFKGKAAKKIFQFAPPIPWDWNKGQLLAGTWMLGWEWNGGPLQTQAFLTSEI